MTGAAVLLATLVATGLLAALISFVNGRFRATGQVDGSHAPDDPHEHVTAAEIGGDLGERVTFVQFSSAFCTPCRATRALLADVASRTPGVAHVEIDAESHLDLVRRLNVLRTPTVFVVAPDGRILHRASGAPTRAQVAGVLDAFV